MSHLPAHAGGGEPLSIYAQMVAAGVPCSSHHSDLYVPVTDASRAIVAAYRWRANVTTFRSDDPADNGARFYDIPFAFDPYWQPREAR